MDTNIMLFNKYYILHQHRIVSTFYRHDRDIRRCEVK